MIDIFLEKGGGGNSFESYDLPWYFAAKRTSIDCFEKRKKKGFLFTVGDENAALGLTVSQVKEHLGDDIQSNMSAEDLFDMASKMVSYFPYSS